MSLFQLMNWLDENNYNDNLEMIVDTPDDMGYNPFELMPANYEGTLDEWEASLDEVEQHLKSDYIRACTAVLEYKKQNSAI